MSLPRLLAFLLPATLLCLPGPALGQDCGKLSGAMRSACEQNCDFIQPAKVPDLAKGKCEQPTREQCCCEVCLWGKCTGKKCIRVPDGLPRCSYPDRDNPLRAACREAKARALSALADIAKAANALLGQFHGAFSNSLQTVTSKVFDLKRLVETAITDAQKQAGDLVGPALSGLQKQVSALAASAPGAAGGIADQLAGWSKCLGVGTAELGNLLGGGAAGKLDPAKLAADAKHFLDDAAGKASQAIAALLPRAKAQVENAKAAGERFVNDLKGTLENAIRGGNPGNWMAQLSQAVEKGKNAVQSAFNEASGWVSGALADAKKAVSAGVELGLAAAKKTAEAAKSAASNLFAGLPEKLKGFGDKIARCFYDNVLAKAGLDKLPPFEFIKTLLRDAQGWVMQLVKDGPGKTLESLASRVMEGLKDFVPRAIEHVMSLRTQIRELLTEKADDPRAALPALDARIRKVLDLALQPIEQLMEQGLSKVLPAGAVAFLKQVGTEPMKKAAVFAFRVIISGRSHIEKAMSVLIPLAMKGASAAVEALQKLPIPPYFKKIVLKAIDKAGELFGGVGAALLDAVAPEVKDVITQIVDSFLAGTDQVEGLLGALPGSNADPSAAFEALKKLGGSGQESEADRAAALAAARKSADETAAAASVAQQAAAQATGKAAKQAEAMNSAKTELDELERQAKENKEARIAAKDLAAAKAKFDAAATAHKAAVTQADTVAKTYLAAAEKAQAAQQKLQSLDPKTIGRRLVAAVSDQVVTAFMKVTWDPASILAEFLSGVLIQCVDVAFSVGAAVLGVITVTTTYTPFLLSAVQTIAGVALNVVKAIGFSLVLPEARTLLEDQLLASVRRILVDMYDGKNAQGDAGTLQKFVDHMKTVFANVKPLLERMKTMNETLKQGAMAIYAGPLGKLFQKLPPELVSAVLRAISKGVAALRDTALKATLRAIKTQGAAGQPITMEEIVDLVIGALAPPVIEFLTVAFTADPELQAALSAGFNDALDAVRARKDMKELLNPLTVLKAIGAALENQQVRTVLAARLTQKLPPGLQTAGCQGSIEASISSGIGRVAALLKSDTVMGDTQQLSKLLSGGAAGLLRAVLEDVKPSLVCMLTKNLPDDLKPSFQRAIEDALALLEDPAELMRVLQGGVAAIIAKVIQLGHAPLVMLVMRQLPDGPLAQSLRAALTSLGQDASSPEFLRKLAAGGVWGIAGEALARAAEPLSLLLTSGLENPALQAEAKAQIERLAADVASGALAEKVRTRGLIGLVADFAKPVRDKLLAAITENVTGPLGEVVKASIERVSELLLQSVDVNQLKALLRQGGKMYLAELRAYVLAILAKGGPLAELMQTPARLLGELQPFTAQGLQAIAGALRVASEAAVKQSLSLPALKEVLR